MYLSDVVTIWKEALENVTGNNATSNVMSELSVHTNYPLSEAMYPCIWVNYSPQGSLTNAGIGHTELVTDNGSTFREAYRYVFGGVVELTFAAMTSLQRFGVMDEFSRQLAISASRANQENKLRSYVEDNDLVGMAVKWESFDISGVSETVGTPWGTDDVIYEGTIGIDIQGEVIFDPVGDELIPLSAIRYSTDVSFDLPTTP